MALQDKSRREFVKMGAAVAGTVATWNATSYAKIVGANDRVRVGVVGCGDRMKQAPDSLVPYTCQGDELRVRGDLRPLEQAARGWRGVYRKDVRAKWTRYGTMTNCMRARMWMRC